MNIRFLCAASMLALSFGWGHADAANLVANGGFETGSFTDWTLSGNTGSTYVGNNPNASHTGDFAAQLGAVGSDDFLSQNLTTTAGAGYTVDFWHIYSPSAGPIGDFSVQWDGNTIFGPVASTNPPSPQVWTEYSINVTGTGSDILTFVSRNDPNYQGLDDVSVTLSGVSPVPLPSSAPMFGAALLVLAGFGYGMNRWVAPKAKKEATAA